MDGTEYFWWFIFIIIILWFVWFDTGGPNREESFSGPFITPSVLSNTEKTYNSISPFDSNDNRLQENLTIKPLNKLGLSIFRDSVFIQNIASGKLSNPQEEYIELLAGVKNTSPILITGWKILNSLGKTLEITQATSLPYLGRINVRVPISLSPGERVIVTTGRSPIGTSFKVNKCSGYLEQFQDFNPPIKKECPSPLVNVDTVSFGLEDACVAYIKTLPRCEVYTGDIPENLSSKCSLFINSQINHNTCIDKHKNDNNFSKREWRIFLWQTTEFWANDKETVRLLDSSNEIVDLLNY